MGNAVQDLLLRIGGDSSGGQQATRDLANALTNTLVKALKDTSDQSTEASHAVDEHASSVEHLTDLLPSFVARYVEAASIIGLAKLAYEDFTELLSGSVEAYGQAEQAEVRLMGGLEAVGKAVPGVVEAYKQYAEELEKTTTVSHTAAIAAEGTFTLIGSVGPAQMQRALQATADFAAVTGKSFDAASLAIAKATDGNVGQLKRYGIEIDKAAVESGGIGVVFDAIEEKMHGQAELMSGTLLGSWQQMSNQWERSEEQLGSKLAPAVAEATHVLGGLVQVIGDSPTAFLAFVGAVTTMAGSMVWMTAASAYGAQFSALGAIIGGSLTQNVALFAAESSIASGSVLGLSAAEATLAEETTLVTGSILGLSGAAGTVAAAEGVAAESTFVLGSAVGILSVAVGGLALIPLGLILIDWAGKMLGFEHATKSLGDELARFIGMTGQADLARETAGAQQDTINHAIQMGADKTITYVQAVTYLNEVYGRNAEAGESVVAVTKKVAAMMADANSSIKDLSGAQIEGIKWYLQQKVGIEETAKMMGVYKTQVEQVKEVLAQHVKDLAAAAKAAKEYGDAWFNLSTLGQTTAQTLAGIGPVILQQASYYAGLGASVHDLEKAFPGLTQAQAEAIESMQRFAAASIPLTAAQQAEAASLLALDVGHQAIAKDIGASVVQVQLFAESLKAVDKNIEESEATGLAAAAAISKAFAGPQTVLKDLLVSTGAVPISLHSILTPMQELGHLMTDVTVEGKEHFDDLGDAITGDFTDIIATMKEQGVETRDDLQLTADKFKTEYDAMAASGKFTTDELTAAWERYRQANAAVQGDVLKTQQQFAALSGVLSGVGSVFQQLSGVGTGLFSTIASEMNQVVGAAEGIGRAMEKLTSNAPGGGFNVQNLAALTAGWVGIFVAMMQVSEAILEAEVNAKKLGEQMAISNQAALDYAATLTNNARGTSAVSGGLLTDYTQFSAALGTAVSNSLDELNRVYANRTINAEEIALGFSEHVAGGINLQRAEALNLKAIIEELGGVANLTANQMHTITLQTGLLFDLIKAGGPIGVEATKTLDDVLGKFGQQALDTGGIVDQFFTDMVEKAREAGIVLPQVAAFFKTEAANAAKGLADLLNQPLVTNAAALGKAIDDAQDALDKLKASGTATASELAKAQKTLADALDTAHAQGVRDKKSLDDLAAVAVTTFNAAIASGMDFEDALKSIGPQLATITKAYKDLGLSIDDVTLKGLALENTLLNGTAENPSGLGTAISGLQATVTASMNFGPGVENAAALKGQQGSLSSLYTQAQAASAAQGVTGDQGTIAALLPFQTTLHQLDDWAKKNNVALDQNTKDMISQSQQLGVWTDNYKTDSEQTRDSLAAVVTSADALAAMMAALPQALADVLAGRTPTLPTPPTPPGGPTGGSSGGSSGGPTNDFPLPGGSRPGLDPNPGSGAGPGASGSIQGVIKMAAGGVVHYLESGGTASNWPWLPQGTDTVPAMLTPGERVLSVDEAKVYDQIQLQARLKDLISQPQTSPLPGLGRSISDQLAGGSASTVYKNYDVSVTSKDPVADEQWLREWMRRDGVEINVEELEDGRHVSRVKRALDR